MIPPLPPNEAERLKVLRRSNLLDTPSEQVFDAITRRAAEICDVPIALVSLIDENRQFLKSRIGCDLTETPRQHAFCAHTILQDDLMIVPDALADERFAQNPLVTGEPKIRFYAGMPLITSEGAALGSLCVIDRVPRQLTTEQKDRLRILSESIRLILDIKASRLGEIFHKAVDASAEGVIVADARQPDTPIIFANRAFYEMTGYGEDEVLGRSCRFLHGEAAGPDRLRDVREMMTYRKDGRPFWSRVSSVPLTGGDGELTYIVRVHSDVTEAKEAEAARQQLLAMTATMNTVNDIVLNFMNNLNLYRLHMEELWNADDGTLREFDSMFGETLARLSEINALTEFKVRTAAGGMPVLDTE